MAHRAWVGVLNNIDDVIQICNVECEKLQKNHPKLESADLKPMIKVVVKEMLGLYACRKIVEVLGLEKGIKAFGDVVFILVLYTNERAWEISDKRKGLIP